jgi:hypothetical protein
MYTEYQLQLKSICNLRVIANKIGAEAIGDKRKLMTWVNAIMDAQQKQNTDH